MTFFFISSYMCVCVCVCVCVYIYIYIYIYIYVCVCVCVQGYLCLKRVPERIELP
jgi:hypothetical protein